MTRSIRALKLTSISGRTTFGRIKLRVGMVVGRNVESKFLMSCTGRAVHAYRSLAQAKSNDVLHCSHGPSGILWLVRLYSPKRSINKLIGTSYEVLRKIGPMYQVNKREVSRLLKAGTRYRSRSRKK